MKREYIINIFRIILVISCIALMWFFWEFYVDDFPVREEYIVEADETENMRIPFAQVSGLAVSLENIKGGYTEAKYVMPVKISIEDENGVKVWEADCGEIELKTHAFTSIENLPNMPVSLEKNKGYSIRCYLDGEESDGIVYAVFGKQKTVGKIYLVCCIVALLLLGFVLWGDRIRITFGWKFAIIFTLLGVLYSIPYMPFSVPDEIIHFGQAYANSNRILGKEIYDDNGYILCSDSGLLRMERCQDETKQGLYRFWSNWEYGNNHKMDISTKYIYVNNLKQYVYFPAAIVVSLMRILDAPYQIVFLSGKFANLFFFIIMILLAIKLCPKFQRVIAAICYLPTTVWLAASYSYDSWNLSLCILFFAYCMYCKDREEKMGWRDLVILCTICVILAPIKVVYILMGACILFIPKDKFKNVYYQMFSYLLVGISSMTAVLKGRGSAAIGYVTTQEQDVRSIVADRHGYTISWVLENPIHTIKVYINTLFERGERYIYTAIGGDFLEYEISPLVIYFILFAFLLIIINELKYYKPNLRERIIASCILGAGSLAVLTAFLFSYSVIHIESIGTINGVQGRYFLPFFILLPIIFQSNVIRLDGKENYLLKNIVVLNMVTVWCNFARIMH